MSRKEKKYYYIYKTTNLINKKYYIGMHSTSNLNDGYIGSGKKLWYSIKKYGRENFKCEILEFLESKELLKEREREIINNKLLNDSMCMNIVLGGGGGPGSKFLTKEQLSRGGKNSMERIKLLRRTDPEYSKKNGESISNAYYKAIKEGRRIPIQWGNHFGRKHKPETIEKMKTSKIEHGVGVKNSQFGTCWITNGVENQKIKKEDLIPEGWLLGRYIKLLK
jgi:group I intron endonuclease